jgi:hypothetical protein
VSVGCAAPAPPSHATIVETTTPAFDALPADAQPRAEPAANLAPKIILEVIGQNRRLLSACYSAGLERNPRLTGRILVRFVVAPDGSVSHASNDGSDLPPEVIGCVVGVFGTLRFPRPERGAVTVTFPLRFDPNGLPALAPLSLTAPPALGVNGYLEPTLIQKIVRQSNGRYRACYEAGLGRDAKLAGRVAVRFVIGRDGRVVSTADADSNLPDRVAVACVIAAFGTLQFPPPSGGEVTVVYPIMFSPEQH